MTSFFEMLVTFVASILTPENVTSGANYSLGVFVIGSVALSLFALIFRLITRIKSFALFGG